MATEFHKIIGELGYSHLRTPDTYKGATRWICDIKPDNPKAFKEINSQLRKNDDGFYRPRRDVKKMMRGDWVEFTAPKLFNSDGTEFEGKFIPRGSKVEVTVSVYSYSFGGETGYGTRLESVRIIELAEMPDEFKSGDATSEDLDNISETTPAKKKLPF